ncbi:hypothetical protein ACWOE5_03120 [Aerococcus sanguinicola]|uniref:DUF3990 domain-containing protein n=1 Tax=Aerococcus sanguinicola TaxID=119206 RepID=A0A0X8FC48_9LACT|nr:MULTISPECIES: hypothetical protein [Aerococcus]AMB94530.1 hypothetical protein AWM72_07090 [Aerococcus sanguinicola]MDK7049409.1 hypothetical protein [Aerococcus sanguinicola]OFT95531.1 hypothetical protein HMPREF3090_04245 [Aerococcus sp. HMSC23C02]PKZ23474.1 hypothetical protein CYJ28_02665 [Aerococcus sanguinicola]
MTDDVIYYLLYHGTTARGATEILKNKEFTFRKRNDHWLGNGIYFFINDLEKAKWWGVQACRRDRLKKLAILQIQNFKINRNDLLDLDTEEDRQKLFNFLQELKSQGISLNTDQMVNEIEMRAYLIEMYVKYTSKIASKQTYYKPSPKHLWNLEEFGIFNLQVQFCIYDNESIDFEKVQLFLEEEI